MIEWGEGVDPRQGRCSRSKDRIKESKTFCDGSRWLVHKVGSRGGQGRGERASKVISLVSGVGTADADRISVKNNLSNSDTVPLVTLVRG